MFDLTRSTTRTTAPVQGLQALFRSGSVLGALLLLVVLGLLPGPASAQDGGSDTASSLKGKLEQVDDTGRTPVEGVAITVVAGGVEVGTAVSGPDGTWSVPLDAGGTFDVSLDEGTLPDGVAMTDPTKQLLPDVLVRDAQDKTVRFNLGPGRTSTVTTFDQLLGLVILGLKLGAIISLSAIGLSLIFGVTGLVNFAHGELVTLGAVLALFFHSASTGPGWPLVVAVVPALAICALLGGSQERFLWRPLRRRKTGTTAMLVVSIGLSFAIRNVILVLMGGEPVNYQDFVIQEQVTFLGISTVPKNLFIIGSTIVILLAVGLFLQKTQTGVAMRAVADNKDLAESSGINVERVISRTWFMGAALAGLGGIYLGASEAVQWNAGFRLLLLIFAAVVLGGLGTAYGAMIGGFAIGLIVEVSTYWINTELKNAVGLAVLIVMLLFRPQGLLGTKERIG